MITILYNIFWLRPEFLLACFIGYLSLLGIYRLLLHPLARFPGPKLAALTQWYEIYYDVVRPGQFTFHIQELHKRYGPIIRINPHELHIFDAEYYEEFYVKQGKLDKHPWMAGAFGNELSTFTTTGFDQHKARKAPMLSLFSRNRILRLEPLIREKSTKMLGRIAQYKESGRPLNLTDAFMAVAEDMIFEFCFGQCYDALDAPDFERNLHTSFRTFITMAHVNTHFPWLPRMMLSLPETWLEKLDATYTIIFRLKRNLTEWSHDAKEMRIQAANQAKHTTIMKAILDSDLPPTDKSIPRLAEEAHVMLTAGLSTTGWAASVTAFYIIFNSTVSRTLRTELESALPDPTAPLEWVRLEKLPYLTGCIKEGIRLSIGESNRAPRVSSNVITYKDYHIPAKTPVSLSVADVAYDTTIFPSPKTFMPERWIGPDCVPEKYNAMFGKGAMACLGQQLAYAELYHMIAGIFRLFDLELYETDLSDVEFLHDFVQPSARLDSQGVRVKVRGDD